MNRCAKVSTALAYLVGAALVADPAVASADEAGAATVAAPVAGSEVPASTAQTLGRKQNFWRLSLGTRVDGIGSSAYDAFAKKDDLTQLSIEADDVFFVRGRFSLAAGLGWDIGSHDGTVRGDTTSLLVTRMSAAVEARWHLAPWLYGFGRVAPGAAWLHASMNDVAKLTDAGWAFSTDLSAGASFLFGSHAHPETRLVRAWMSPEVGWAFTTAVPLSLTPSDRADDDTRPVGAVDLGKLSLSGPFVRVKVAVTY